LLPSNASADTMHRQNTTQCRELLVQDTRSLPPISRISPIPTGSAALVGALVLIRRLSIGTVLNNTPRRSRSLSAISLLESGLTGGLRRMRTPSRDEQATMITLRPSRRERATSGEVLLSCGMAAALAARRSVPFVESRQCRWRIAPSARR
jgi:hypothetical protein